MIMLLENFMLRRQLARADEEIERNYGKRRGLNPNKLVVSLSNNLNYFYENECLIM